MKRYLMLLWLRFDAWCQRDAIANADRNLSLASSGLPLPEWASVSLENRCHAVDLLLDAERRMADLNK